MSHEFNHRSRSLEEILGDEKLREYAFDGDAAPIMFDRLPDEVKGSKVFESTLGVVGWPDEEDARTLARVRQYRGIQDFMDASFNATYVDEAGRMVTRSDELNNFHTLLRYRPAEINSDGEVIADVTSNESRTASTHPALIRAQLLIPELLGVLRGRFDEQKTENIPRPSTKDVYESDPYIVQGAYMAYRVMGRLVSRFDRQIQARIQGERSDVVEGFALESSAHESLVR